MVLQQQAEECTNVIDYSSVLIGDSILPFVFELDLDLSILDPPAGQNQRWCYRVTGVGEDTQQYIDLSHWVLSLCPTITLDQITNVQVTIGGVPQTVIIGDNVELIIPPDTDPETGCPGLKFDFAVSKVLDAPDSVGYFCFELTCPYPVAPVNVCVKGGEVSSSALAICGPVCAAGGCTVTTSQMVDVCVPITIQPQVCIGGATTICCGEAGIGDECAGEPGGACTFTVTQSICVEVPVRFTATASRGQTYVDCGTVSIGECVCPEE